MIRRVVLLSAVVGALMVPATATAGPYWNDPFDRAGPIEKHDPTPIWLDKLLDSVEPASGQHDAEDGHNDRHRTKREAERRDPISRLPQTASDPYEERLARGIGNDRAEESKRENEDNFIRQRMRCMGWRLEYLARHGTTTPRPLRRLFGCDKWSADHYYWQRRKATAGLYR